MKLEAQVCSLELAKRLKELGVKQESLFWWFIPFHQDVYFVEEAYVADVEGDDHHEKSYSAFTVAELGEMLPQYILHAGLSKELVIVRSSVWRFYYGQIKGGDGEIYLTAGYGDTEADARAKMLIYLIEHKLINPLPCPKN